MENLTPEKIFGLIIAGVIFLVACFISGRAQLTGCLIFMGMPVTGWPARLMSVAGFLGATAAAYLIINVLVFEGPEIYNVIAVVLAGLCFLSLYLLGRFSQT